MSKRIRITQDIKDDILSDITKFLENGSILSDGKISFTKTLEYKDRKATLLFTPEAYVKMTSLVDKSSKEIAWHGIAERYGNEDEDKYIIKDILVYPQEVTASTVNTDQEEYQKWLISLDDETFENLKMQGHSHVNMCTSPSAVDLAHQQKIIDQMEDDMFYIFLIWNKKGDRNIKIYDTRKNCLFETADVDVEIQGCEAYVEESLKMVKEQKWNANKPKTTIQNDVPQYITEYNTSQKYGNDKKSIKKNKIKHTKHKGKGTLDDPRIR